MILPPGSHHGYAGSYRNGQMVQLLQGTGLLDVLLIHPGEQLVIIGRTASSGEQQQKSVQKLCSFLNNR